MKIIIAFFMAWGNFITLPCPYKRWDNSLKNLMLAFLPSVGLVVGALWCLVYLLLNLAGIPVMVSSFVMVLYIFYVCGFMHMDGFMDCNDAIMSRRDLAERQRILKDSTVGAFAALTAIFLILGWYSAMTTSYMAMEYGILLIIPVISRAVGGMAVLDYKPIGHSQYVKDFEAPSKWKYRSVIAAQVAVISIIAILISSSDFLSVITVVVVMAVAGYIACAYARKQLGGMSGDVAGYTICVSEVAGILTAAVIL